MNAPARTYYDADSLDGRPTFSPAGIAPSKSAERVSRVIGHAFKSMSLPFDDRSHMPVRRYISRMRLAPAALAMLVRNLGSHDAGRYPIPDDADRCQRYGCTYGEYRQVVFFCYRAALSLLVETAPRSRLDLDDLLEILTAWPGGLPPSVQCSVADAVNAHMADIIAGRPFKRRALVPRGRVRRS